MIETNRIYNMDCMEGMRLLPDKVIDLVLIDPPYFKIMVSDWKGKKYDWDNQWDTFEDYLSWMEEVGKEIKRVLKDNGSLYVFVDDKNGAYIQIGLDKFFYLENVIIWVKPNNLTIKGWKNYRSYSPITEKILFYSNDWSINEGKNNQFSKYLREEFKKANISNGQIAKLFPSKTGRLTGCVSNWLSGNNIITKEQYIKIRKYLNGEYLKKDYEYLRRYFNPIKNFTDVWTFNITSSSEDTFHPTQKPLELIKRIIRTSSKEGMLVLDCFLGSGTTVVACKQLGRGFIGFEKSKEYYEIAVKRTNKTKRQSELMNFRLGEFL